MREQNRSLHEGVAKSLEIELKMEEIKRENELKDE